MRSRPVAHAPHSLHDRLGCLLRGVPRHRCGRRPHRGRDACGPPPPPAQGHGPGDSAETAIAPPLELVDCQLRPPRSMRRRGSAASWGRAHTRSRGSSRRLAETATAPPPLAHRHSHRRALSPASALLTALRPLEPLFRSPPNQGRRDEGR
jgi:hypothetical protein